MPADNIQIDPMHRHDQLEPLLAQLETELRNLGLWDIENPGQEALCSEVAFSHDTLKFHQWLQWIFIPRTRMLIRNRVALPTQSDIHSMAELYFQTQTIEATRVLVLLKSIDLVFSS